MRVFKFLNRLKPSQVLPTGRMNMGHSGGTLVSEESGMEIAAYYRGVIYISTQIAKLPWEVKDDKNQIINNDISYFLNVAPNDEMNAMSFKLFLVQCAINTGGGFAEIERGKDGRILALWPLNPKRVRSVRDQEDGSLWYEVSQDYGKMIYLAPRDMFHIRNPHTIDGLNGLGIIGYAMNTLGIALAADRFANSLFTNGGLPAGALTIPGTISEDARKKIAESWKENHGGRRTGGTAILEEGVTYSPLSHTPDVLQFLESRKFSVTEIARFLGLPPTKLFDTSAAKFNNIEHSNLEVATDTLDAWARIMESEADMKLLSGRKAGRRTELNLYAIFRGDMNTRSQYFLRMLQSGAMTSNEIRVEEGMAPYAGGDRYYIAANNLSPVDRIDEVITAGILNKTKSSNVEEPEEDNEQEEGEDTTAKEATQAAIDFLRSKILN